MKISDLLKTFKKPADIFSGYADNSISNEFDYYGCADWIYDNDCPLRCYLHPDVSWICTDTGVGISLIFFKEEFVGIKTQTARKSDSYYYWLNQDCFDKVKKWFFEQEMKNKNLSPSFFEMDFDVSNWAEQKKSQEEFTREIRKKI